jgi:threonine/homoserine/homoserine lactone efflux protein
MNTHFSPARVSSTSSCLYAGFLISFIGSLPPGTTNIIMINVAGAGHLSRAVSFALGCLVAEVICVKLCLTLIHGAFRYQSLERMIQWLSLAMLAFLSIASFTLGASGYSGNLASFFPNDQSPFVIGFLMMALNPVQIPFWLGWTLIVFERSPATFHSQGQHLYLAGIAAGSLLASALFIFLGRALSVFLIEHQQIIHFILGFAFGAMALMQVKKIFRKTMN